MFWRILKSFVVAALFLVTVLHANMASAESLKDTLAQVDTGAYSATACTTAINSLIGGVEGLGIAELSNLAFDDDMVSGDLKLPIGGTWGLYLFSADCSKDLFALLVPGNDLKFSDMVSSAPVLEELDKLGLVNQAFILSNTDGTINAGDAPEAIATAITAATDGDESAEIEVKAGLTVLGVMDLSQSTYTSKALSFLGLKDSESKKIAVDAVLGAEMLESILKGSKPEADFTITGTMPSVSLTLPGGHALPSASLGFSADVHPDAKDFEMTVEVEGSWDKALGIPGLSLSNVVIDLKAGDETSAEMAAETKLGSQTLAVEWSVEKADEGSEVAIKLTEPDDKTFNIGTLMGLSKVPGINSLGFKELEVSSAGFGGRVIWNNKELDAAVVTMGSGNTPVVMFKTEEFALKDIAKAIGNTPLGNVTLPGMIFTLAENDPGSIDMDNLPDVASLVLGELAEKTNDKLQLHQGVGVLGMIDSSHLGDSGSSLGASGELVLGGTLGGIFGGDPEIDLYAALPTFSSKKMPKFLAAAKDVTPMLTLAFKEANGIEADIGVDLVTHIKVGKQTLELDTAITAVIATSGVGINISASLDKWVDAFELKGLEMDDVAISIEVDADSSVSAGFQGTVELKDGKTKFTVLALMSPDLAAVGLPKEVVFELSANEISLEGLMDLADVFIGATGNNDLAKAAKGKGLFKTMQFNKLPQIKFVQYKTDDGDMEDVRIYLATPGATDPALDIDGMGLGLEGRMKIAGKDIAQVKMDISEHGFELDGEVLIHKLGPLKIKNAEIDADASLDELPHLHINADATLLGVEEDITIEFSAEKVGFSEESKFGQTFTSEISAWATLEGSKEPDFDVTLDFKGDILDAVLGGIETELNNLIKPYEKDVKAAEAAFKKAKKKLDDEEKTVDDAIRSAEKKIEDEAKKIQKAIDKVNGLVKTINGKKDTAHDKSKALHKLHWYQVGKAISLSLQIAGIEIEIGSLYAAKAVAVAALEVAKSATSLVPALFEVGVLAANAAFETAKGAIEVADIAVQATEYILEGLKKLIEAYRDNFGFTEAKFDGSLQALLGNKPITMDIKFKVFGDNIDLDLSFTPLKPENITKAIGGMAAKMGKEAVDGIKHAFFGGGSSHSNKHTQAVANWAEKNNATQASSGFGGADWSGSGPSNQSIPMKGLVFTNASDSKCLLFKSGKLSLDKKNSCDDAKDDHIFRFSPKGDLVAVASGTKKPYCLETKGTEAGSSVTVAKCSGAILQKWKHDENLIKTTSGLCFALGSKGTMELAECKVGTKKQTWNTKPIADLAKLSETPQTHIYGVSFRDTKTGKCVDAADKMLLAYECDGEDYQTFNLNGSGQLKTMDQCIHANTLRLGSSLYLSSCDGKEPKWEWIGKKMQVQDTKLCLNRGVHIPAPLDITPIQLGKCNVVEAEWEEEPANVDAEGRILPAYHMIRSKAYNKCVEIRTKLQIDGLPIPQTLLWNCNGDFNQSFSFQWNGEIRSLGKCLSATNKRGSRVELEDCYRRPSAFQITPDMLKNPGQSRHGRNKQRWKVRKDGSIHKKGTKLCLSAEPTGLHMLQTLKITGTKFSIAPPQKGSPGNLGSLMVLENCKKNDKLQTWIIDDKLPSGKKFAGYQSISHKVDGKTRCMASSGNDTVRKIISRDCKSGENEQQFAVTDYGEIRQMGRCLTTNTGTETFHDGFLMDMEECTDSPKQKWSPQTNGLILQGDKSNTVRCIAEGPEFGPKISLRNLPKALQAAMSKMPTFALMGSQMCTLQIENTLSKKCIEGTPHGVLTQNTCVKKDTLKARQVMVVSHGKLGQVKSMESTKWTVPLAWKKYDVPTLNAMPMGPAAPNTLKDILKVYSNSGFIYQAKSEQFMYVDNKKKTKTCLVPPKSGKAKSESILKKLQKDYITKLQQWGSLDMMYMVNKSIKSKLKVANKAMDAAEKKYYIALKSGALTTANCSSSSSEKWLLKPVPKTAWTIK